jgi:hypothetical protein
MPEPRWDDILDQDVEISDDTARQTLCRLADRQTALAYWQGRCEGLELSMVEIRAGHARELAALKEGHETVLIYFKDRLDRLEAGKEKANA